MDKALLKVGGIMVLVPSGNAARGKHGPVKAEIKKIGSKYVTVKILPGEAIYEREITLHIENGAEKTIYSPDWYGHEDPEAFYKKQAISKIKQDIIYKLHNSGVTDGQLHGIAIILNIEPIKL